MLQITYKNTVKDLFCFYMKSFFTSPMILGFIGVSGLLGIYYSYVTLEAQQINVYLKILMVFLPMVFMTLFIFVVELIIFFFFLRSIKGKRLLLTQSITLTEANFRQEMPGIKGEYDWNILYKVKKTKTHLLLYLTKRAAMLIPLRVFDDKKHSDDFYDFCKRKIEKI